MTENVEQTGKNCYYKEYGSKDDRKKDNKRKGSGSEL